MDKSIKSNYWLAFLKPEHNDTKSHDEGFEGEDVLGPVRTPFPMNHDQFLEMFKEKFDKYQDRLLYIAPAAYNSSGSPTRRSIYDFRTIYIPNIGKKDAIKKDEEVNSGGIKNANNKFLKTTKGGHKILSVFGPDASGSYVAVIENNWGKFISLTVDSFGKIIDPSTKKEDPTGKSYELTRHPS